MRVVQILFLISIGIWIISFFIPAYADFSGYGCVFLAIAAGPFGFVSILTNLLPLIVIIALLLNAKAFWSGRVFDGNWSYALGIIGKISVGAFVLNLIWIIIPIGDLAIFSGLKAGYFLWAFSFLGFSRACIRLSVYRSSLSSSSFN